MTQGKSHNNSDRQLDKLRVIVAQAIFCNGVNRDTEPTDISASAALHELYGQYCLKICLNWLATKYGFPIYTPGINPGFHADLEPLSAAPSLLSRYPFNTPEDITLSEAGLQAAYEHLDQNFEPQIELIGRMYIRLLCDRSRGEFYTPVDVVDRCVALLALDKRLPERVLDPACGTGNFLLGVARGAGQLPGFTGSRLSEWAECSLYGNDIDPRAVELAKLSLLLAIRPDNVDRFMTAMDRHLVVSDALIDVPCREPDVVITNPPYISYGSRNQPAMPLSQAKFLRQSFPASSEYKIRIHSIFQEIALQRVRAGGQAVLLVPDSFLIGAYYKKLRRQIAETAHVKTLCELPESTFKDAVAGRWCIAHYIKGPAEGHTRLLRADGKQIYEQFEIPQADLIARNDKFRFQVRFGDADLAITRKMAALPMLGQLARGHTGLRAREGQKSIVADRCISPDHKRGLTSGASVHQHSIRWAGDWLHIQPAKLFAGGFDPSIIEQPKILMRQTADRIIAAVDNGGLYHLNNVHSFAPTSLTVPKHLIYFLAGVMNSSFWLYLYQMRSREHKRALAQIDIEMIESMPMPVSDAGGERRIAALVEECMNDLDKRRNIDDEIYKLYDLTSAEIAHVERRLEASGYLSDSSGIARGGRN